MGRGGAADRVGAYLGKPDLAHVAGLHEFADRTHGLLDRDLGVEPRRAVDVDLVSAEAPERVGGRGLDRSRAGVVAKPAAVRAALGAELDAQPVAIAGVSASARPISISLWPMP